MLASDSASEAAWLHPQCPRLPYFHGNPFEFPKYFYSMTLSDPPIVSLSNFVKIGPESAEEIENKGKQCPNLPACVLSCFIVWYLRFNQVLTRVKTWVRVKILFIFLHWQQKVSHNWSIRTEPLLGVISEQGECPFRHKGAVKGKG